MTAGRLGASFSLALALLAGGCASEQVFADVSAQIIEIRPAPAQPEAEAPVASPTFDETPAPELEQSGPTEPPQTPPFAGREQVSVDELLAELSAEIPAVADSPAVREDFERFSSEQGLEGRERDDALYQDYVRVKLAFEATRAGGLWGLAWDITNEQPNSEKIWAAWQTLDAPRVPESVAELDALPEITAIAECDELSALFAFVTHRIGLSRASEVGLFWPTGNHVVAVWTIDAKGDDPVRVIVPTSQIFLDAGESLGTRGFNPRTQKNIFNYRRQDAPGKLKIPAVLAARFVLSVRAEAGRGQAELQAQRNAKEWRQQELM